MSFLLGAVARLAPGLARAVAASPPFRGLASRALINRYAYAAKPRPRPFSMAGDYTSWKSLTDRSYSGRHLGPVDAADLPDPARVVDLFRRETFVPATDTSTLFAFFAQWFTDSFLRTAAGDPARNTSTHEIDLCQIYGLDEIRTRMLRAGEGGRLRSQMIEGAEFPAFLLDRDPAGGAWRFRPEFMVRTPRRDLLTGEITEIEVPLHGRELMLDRILKRTPDAEKALVFATGLEHGNSTIGSTLMNVLFLREHNRIARLLEQRRPDWDDDRLFETTRNIMIVILLKIVIEDYIRHIAPYDFPLVTPPFVADGELWNRSNWISIEFNLLYRWHMLVPDEIPAAGEDPPIGWRDLRDNNRLVIDRGVGRLCDQLSRARAGRIGLWNTPAFLHERRPQADGSERSAEERTIDIMRRARLAPYNDYRAAFGLKKINSFEALTSDPKARAALEAMYGDIDSVEWFVGLFAEDHGPEAMMGELLTTMVAYDAFTQALTNPLLSRNVFNEDTFTATGLGIIRETSGIADLVARNAEPSATPRIARFATPRR